MVHKSIILIIYIELLPSDKLTVFHGKSQSLIGKSTINGPYSTNYQRVLPSDSNGKSPCLMGMAIFHSFLLVHQRVAMIVNAP